jgi:hypothetical protein
MKYALFRVRVKKLRSSEIKLLFRKVSILGVSKKGRFPFQFWGLSLSSARPPLLVHNTMTFADKFSRFRPLVAWDLVYFLHLFILFNLIAIIFIEFQYVRRNQGEKSPKNSRTVQHPWLPSRPIWPKPPSGFWSLPWGEFIATNPILNRRRTAANRRFEFLGFWSFMALIRPI